SSPFSLSYDFSHLAIKIAATELPKTLTQVLSISSILSTQMIKANPCGFKHIDTSVVRSITIDEPGTLAIPLDVIIKVNINKICSPILKSTPQSCATKRAAID